MMNIVRLFMLVLLGVFTVLYIAIILYIPDFFGEGDLTKIDINVVLQNAKIPAIVMVAMMVLLLTPLGDFFIGLFLPTRKRSLRDDEKINPAMEIVRRLYQDKYSTFINPKIYVMDFPDMNGMAFGKNTIAVSSGLLKVADEEEIAAVLAHETGHLYNRDGIYNALLYMCLMPSLMISYICGVFFLSSYGILFVVSLLCAPLFTALWVVSLPVYGLYLLSEKITRWPVEYKADQFALKLGLGAGLISLLDSMEDQDIRAKEGFLQKYAYTHPPTALRIDRLERALMKDIDTLSTS